MYLVRETMCVCVYVISVYAIRGLVSVAVQCAADYLLTVINGGSDMVPVGCDADIRSNCICICICTASAHSSSV